MNRPLDTGFSGAPLQGPRGRLSDFSWAGRGGPLAAFIAIAGALFVWRGPSAAFWLLTELWMAYSVAWLALTTLARVRGIDAPWRSVIPTAVMGIVLGGVASAAIALAPNWRAMLDTSHLLAPWGLGAAFSAFFVGLSLVTAEVRRRDQLMADARRQLLEARLQTLTAQIEPHFLMNTLANLRYLINSDAPAASRLLDHLADFLQGALERSRTPRSTLGAEVALVASYLTIMQVRLGERLTFTVHAPSEFADVPFPPLLLQTLVENALRHGIEPSEAGGRVEVNVERRGDRITVSVRDNGVGLAPDSAPGVGLHNTRERLATFYDGTASLELAPALPSGAVVAISIPAIAA